MTEEEKAKAMQKLDGWVKEQIAKATELLKIENKREQFQISISNLDSPSKAVEYDI